MKAFVNTILGGAIGLLGLYLVGHIAYKAGYDVAKAECYYDDICRKTEELQTSEKKVADDAKQDISPRKRSKKESALWRLIRHPDEHQVEAFVDGDELRVNVKPKNA